MTNTKFIDAPFFEGDATKYAEIKASFDHGVAQSPVRFG